MYRKYLHLLCVVCVWTVVMLPTSMMAQTNEPNNPPAQEQQPDQNPWGGNLVFLPTLIKAAPREWSAPVPMLLRAGADGQVQGASTNAWCVNLLNGGLLLAASQVCLDGSLYPALINKGSAVSAAGWIDGEAIAVEGPITNVEPPTQIHRRILLGNVIMDAGELFQWGKGPDVGFIPIYLSPNVEGAEVDQTPPVDEVELARRLETMQADVLMKFGVPVPATFPVYDFTGEYYSTLGGLCPEELAGRATWPWYFMSVIFDDDGSLLLTGEWGLDLTQFDRLQWGIRICMGNYKFFKWNQIRDDPLFAPFRQAVLTEPSISKRPRMYKVSSWGDDQLGGEWYMSMWPAGTGAVIIAAQYLREAAGILQPVAGVVDRMWLIIPDPQSRLACGVFGDPNTCMIKNQ